MRRYPDASGTGCVQLTPMRRCPDASGTGCAPAECEDQEQECLEFAARTRLRTCGPSERTTLSHRWAWREVSQIGEEFFDLLEKPFKKSAFVEFVKNAEVTSGIAEIPPLEDRYRLIKGSPETRGFYEKVLTAIKKENSDGLTELYVREILSGLAGMFMVLSADGMCALSLGQFLALGKTSRERARGYPEKSYTRVCGGSWSSLRAFLSVAACLTPTL
jgi:hypothetical protein